MYAGIFKQTAPESVVWKGSSYAIVLKSAAFEMTPRDSHGRWTRNSGSAEGLALEKNHLDFNPEDVVRRALSDDPAKITAFNSAIESVNADVKAGLETNKVHSKDGKGHGGYTKERLAFHAKIMDHYFQNADNAKPNPPPPTLTILGGRGGSGKGNFNADRGGEFGVYSKKKNIVIDPDEIKAMLPDYVPEKAYLVHQESSHIADRIAAEARKRGLNVVLDQTLKSDKSRVVSRFMAEGYDMEAYYMHKAPQEAIASAVQRWDKPVEVYNPITKETKTFPRDRLVPPSVIAGNTNNEKNFDKITRRAKKWKLVANESPTGFAGRVIDSGGHGQTNTRPKKEKKKKMEFSTVLKGWGRMPLFEQRTESSGWLSVLRTNIPILKSSEAAKKAWVTIKLKKHFGAADSWTLKHKMKEMKAWLEDNVNHPDYDKNFADALKLQQYLDTGSTDHLDAKGAMKPAKKPAMTLHEFFDTPKPTTPGEAPKFSPQGGSEQAKAQNHELGKHYYKMREQFGKDSPEAQAAYKEWQKAKDDLMSTYGLSKSEIGTLSGQAKSAYETEKANAPKSPEPPPEPLPMTPELEKALKSKKIPDYDSDPEPFDYPAKGAYGDVDGEVLKHGRKMMHQLTQDEREAVSSYTGSGYRPMNKAAAKLAKLGSKANVDDYMKERIDHLDSALMKSTLGKNMRLRRNMAQKWLWEGLGVNISDAEKMTQAQLDQFIGKTYRETAFSSTTMRKDGSMNYQQAASQGVAVLRIRAGKNMPGANVVSESAHHSESEVILPRGTTYIIRKIRRTNHGDGQFEVEVDMIGAFPTKH